MIMILILSFPIYTFAQWTSTRLPGTAADGITGIAYDGTDVYTCMLGGPDTAAVYRLHNGVWSPTNKNAVDATKNLWSIIAINHNLLLAGSWSYGIFFSSDQGDHWSNYLNPPTAGDSLIFGFAYDGTTIYACGGDSVNHSLQGLIFTSTDGKNWTPMDSLPAHGKYAVNTLCWTGSRLFAGTDGGVYYYSGSSWHSLNVIPYLMDSDRVFSLAYDTLSSHLYVGTHGATVIISDNANTATRSTVSWTTGGVPTNYGVICFGLTSDGTITAGCGDGVYFSVDHGVNWTQMNDGLLNLSANVLLDVNGTTYVGLDQGYVGTLSDASLPVQVSTYQAMATDQGVNLMWSTQSEVRNAGFNVLRQDPGTPYFKLIAGYLGNDSLRGLGTSTTGRSYSFTDTKVQSGLTYQYKLQSVSLNGIIGDIGSLFVTVKVPESYTLYQNYPNPFNPSTKIRFDLPQQSRSSLAIYNVLGQLLEEIDYGVMGAGSYEKELNMARYSSGMYFYRIDVISNNGEHFTATKKMVLTK